MKRRIMKVTVLNSGKKSDDFPISSILLFILGLFLAFNSGGVLSALFIFLGIIISVYGIYKFIRFYQIKNQFHFEDSRILMSAITSLIIGILTILLASFLTNAIQIITGIWLIVSGLNKLETAPYYKSSSNRYYTITLIVSVLLILLGIYSIFAENVVFVLLGILLIIYSVIDILNYLLKKK